jgi:hypothetical protein
MSHNAQNQGRFHNPKVAGSIPAAATSYRSDEARQIVLTETKTSLCTQFGFWNVLERIWLLTGP